MGRMEYKSKALVFSYIANTQLITSFIWKGCVGNFTPGSFRFKISALQRFLTYACHGWEAASSHYGEKWHRNETFGMLNL